MNHENLENRRIPYENRENKKKQKKIIKEPLTS